MQVAIILDAIRAIAGTYGADWRMGLLGLASTVANMQPAAIHKVWTTSLREFGARERSMLLGDLALLAPSIVAMDGPRAALAIADSVQDIGRWWP